MLPPLALAGGHVLDAVHRLGPLLGRAPELLRADLTSSIDPRAPSIPIARLDPSFLSSRSIDLVHRHGRDWESEVRPFRSGVGSPRVQPRAAVVPRPPRSYSRRRTARVGVDRGPKHGPPAVTRPRRVRVVGLTRGTRLAPLGVEGGRARLSTSRPATKARPEAARGLPRVERQRTAARPRSPLARTPSATPRARARVWVHTADLLAMGIPAA